MSAGEEQALLGGRCLQIFPVHSSAWRSSTKPSWGHFVKAPGGASSATNNMSFGHLCHKHEFWVTHAVVTSSMRWMLSRGDANLPFVSPTPGRGPSPVPVCVTGSEGTWQELCHSHNLLVGGTENHGLIWLGKDLLKLVSFQWEGHLRFL